MWLILLNTVLYTLLQSYTIKNPPVTRWKVKSTSLVGSGSSFWGFFHFSPLLRIWLKGNLHFLLWMALPPFGFALTSNENPSLDPLGVAQFHLCFCLFPSEIWRSNVPLCKCLCEPQSQNNKP